jgi:hypothetical protein
MHDLSDGAYPNHPCPQPFHREALLNSTLTSDLITDGTPCRRDSLQRIPILPWLGIFS